MLLCVGTVIALKYYHVHPFSRFRRGEIGPEQLCELMGEHRFSMLIHKLTLEGQVVAEEDDV